MMQYRLKHRGPFVSLRDMVGLCRALMHSLFCLSHTSTVTHEATGELQSQREVRLLLEDLLKKLPDLDNAFISTQHSFTAMACLREHPPAVHNVKKV